MLNSTALREKRNGRRKPRMSRGSFRSERCMFIDLIRGFVRVSRVGESLDELRTRRYSGIAGLRVLTQ